MNIYDYFNSKTIAEYWRDNDIEPTTWDWLKIIHESDKTDTWDEKRAAFEEVLRVRADEPLPEPFAARIAEKREYGSEAERRQFENLDTSSLFAYTRQFISRRDELARSPMVDGTATHEAFDALNEKYGMGPLLLFSPFTLNMRKHPFETGDIVIDTAYTVNGCRCYHIIAEDKDEAYSIDGNGNVELSPYQPWDCELARLHYFGDTTDNFEGCPWAFLFIAQYLEEDIGETYGLAELLNEWTFAVTQDFPKKSEG